MLIQSLPCLNSIFSQILCTIQICTVNQVFFMNPLHFLHLLCFEWYWAQLFFQGWLTSRSSDNYLTTIKNSSQQGKLLGRVQEGGEEGTYPSDPYHTFHRGTHFSQHTEKNHKSVSSTDPEHELRCFSSALQICFTQWVGLWATSVWILIHW